MATIGELKEALKETLERSGYMNKVKAQVRAEVFRALETKEDLGPPPVSDENVVINELIREYLEYNYYVNTQSVMIPETGQGEKPSLDRSFLASHLKIREDYNTRQVPLLYSLVSRSTLMDDPGPEVDAQPRKQK